MATQTYPQLVDALDDVRRQWRQRKLLEGVLLTAACALAVLVALVAADNLLALGTFGRLLTAAFLWTAVAVAVMTWVVRRVLEQQRDDFFAVLVERRHPELRNRLINGLQLGRGNDFGSPRLIDAIVQDAAAATADIDMGDCVDDRPMKQAGMFLAAACVVIAGYALLTPRFFNGLSRVLFPVATIEPYTATKIDESSIRPHEPNNRFPEGSTIPIEFKVSGVIPRTAQIYRKTGEGRWVPASVPVIDAAENLNSTNEPRGMFRFNIVQPVAPFDFYIAAGDASSRVYHVDVVKRPQIEGISLTYRLPEYAATKPHVVERSDGEIAGICGTIVDLQIRFSKPLREASLATEKDQIVTLEQGADSRSWKASFTLWQKGLQHPENVFEQIVEGPTRYQVRMQDTDGYDNGDPLWYGINVTKDLAPTVMFVAPGRDVQVQPQDKREIKSVVKDDLGVGPVRYLFRVNDQPQPRELAHFAHDGAAETEATDAFTWDLSGLSLKSGDIVRYWAVASDRNTLTGPGTAESRHLSLFVFVPEQVIANLDVQIEDYAGLLEDLLRLQKQNRAETASGVAFANLVARQVRIRGKTADLAKAMRRDATPLATIVEALEELHSGLLADVVRLLEQGRDAGETALATAMRNQSLPVQDEIITRFQALLARMQRNEQARKELKKLSKADKAAHNAITQALSQIVKDLDRLVDDEKELAEKFEKMPKRVDDPLKEEALKAALQDLDELQEKWGKWQKGTVDDLTKLPTGFVDDFSLKEDVNSVFEEIEKQANRAKASSLEVSLEDLGASLATEMLEDLELWMPDAPDALKWVQEEPLGNKPMNIPEMPLPDSLEDLVGDLMQEAEEFDEEADDITSAWGDNLNQAGWGVSDGPISSFSAKGKTGNDLPNTHEVTGRSGDGRRGKSAGQMVGDTSRGLPGRKTPARVGNERYEPGQLKEETKQDPAGATGGGKKSGSGKKGLQGGTPPDIQKDMDRLSAKQAGMREKAERVAERLDSAGLSSRRLNESIELMKQSQIEPRDLRYEDGFRKQKVALSQLKTALGQLHEGTAVDVRRARDLPAQLRQELLQSSEEGYPPGYESLAKSYFRALSEAEKD
jgi:hypothetical protein